MIGNISPKDLILLSIHLTSYGFGNKKERNIGEYSITPLTKEFNKIAKLDGRKVRFTIEADIAGGDNRFYKELVQKSDRNAKAMLDASHIDIYTAAPKGQAWDWRVKIAGEVMRRALKAEWLSTPVRRKTKDEAKSQFGATRTSNYLWLQIVRNMEGLA